MHFAFYHCRALTFKWFFIFRVFLLTSLWFLFLFRLCFAHFHCTLSDCDCVQEDVPVCEYQQIGNTVHFIALIYCLIIIFLLSRMQRATTWCHFVLFSFFFSPSLSVSLFRSLLGWLYIFLCCGTTKLCGAARPAMFFLPNCTTHTRTNRAATPWLAPCNK